MRKNIDIRESRTLSQSLSDAIASTVGSWKFVIFQSCFIILWLFLNSFSRLHWDVYPFILLNLVLSFQAAYTAPIIMMSQNRQAERDRQRAEADYQINVLAEREIETILTQLEKIDAKMMKHEDIKDELLELRHEVRQLKSDILR